MDYISLANYDIILFIFQVFVILAVVDVAMDLIKTLFSSITNTNNDFDKS
jgi:hypothetical protein